MAELAKEPVKLKAVEPDIQGYFDPEFSEVAPPRGDGKMVHYLPIQAVFKQRADQVFRLRTRVMKDASARRSHEPSLNQRCA